jgi:bile acid:Na+ symporter, BASS family
MLVRGLSFFATYASMMLALGALTGLALPDLAAASRPLLTPSVFVLLFLALVRIESNRFSHISRHPVPILLGGLWLMLGAPILLWCLGTASGLDPSMVGALALAAGAPPLMASSAFAIFLGLDATLAVIILLLATLSAPLTIAFVDELLSLAQAINGLELMASLAAIVVGAAGAAVLTRQVVDRAQLASYDNPLSGLSIVALVVLSIASMDGVLARLVAEPAHALLLLGAAFAMNIVLQIVTGLIFFWTGRMRAVTIAFCGGNRNVALLLTVMPAQAHPDFALFFALAQLPMYLLPVLTQPVYRRLAGAAVPDGVDSAGGGAEPPTSDARKPQDQGLAPALIQARLGWRLGPDAAVPRAVRVAEK